MMCKMRPLVLSAVVAGALAAGTARGGEEPRPRPMGRKNAREFLAGVVKARAEVETVSAEFTDIQRSFILEDETRAKGYLRMKKPDCVRRDILSPSRSLIILRAGSGWFCQPKQKPRAFNLDNSKGKDAAGTIFRLLMAESFELSEIEKRFEVKTFAVGEDLMLDMRPKEKSLAEDMPVIRITFARRGVWPRRVEWESRDGDVTTDTFDEPAVNGEIPDGIFSVPIKWDEKLPPDAPKTGPGAAKGEPRCDDYQPGG